MPYIVLEIRAQAGHHREGDIPPEAADTNTSASAGADHPGWVGRRPMTQQTLPESGSGTQAVAVLVGFPAWGAVSEGFGFGVEPSAFWVLSLPAVPVVAVWDGWTGGFADSVCEAAGV